MREFRSSFVHHYPQAQRPDGRQSCPHRDLSRAYLLSAREMLGLREPVETLTVDDQSRCDLGWVAHDVRKFTRMTVNHNGYVLEQLFSPLVVVSTPAFEELRSDRTRGAWK